jgi:hypothetical protein
MVLKILVAVVAFVVIVKVGVFFLRALATPTPVPDAGELRKVNLRYECTICGAQVKMTKAGEDLPPPPRHCLEDMELKAPAIE